MKSMWTLLPASLAAAAVSVSCGQVADNEGPTTPASIAPAMEENPNAGGVSASGVERVLICHLDAETGTLEELRVPEPALVPHLQHGDVLGACSVACPCFSSADIQGIATTQCNVPTSSFCITGDPYELYLGCESTPGGSVPPDVIGIYSAQASDGGSCSRNDTDGSFEQTGLAAAQHQACIDAIGQSGFCAG